MTPENIIFALVFLIFALLIDYKNLPNLKKRDKILYLSVASVSFLLIFLYSLDVNIPSPSLVIMDLIKKFITK